MCFIIAYVQIGFDDGIPALDGGAKATSGSCCLMVARFSYQEYLAPPPLRENLSWSGSVWCLCGSIVVGIHLVHI